MDDENRPIALFASRKTCAKAIRQFIHDNSSEKFQLALLSEGTGLSQLRTWWSTLDDIVLRQPRPTNVAWYRRSMPVSQSFLLPVNEIVWFFDGKTTHKFSEESGDYACALNVALGCRMGLSLSCFDKQGFSMSSPLEGDFGGYISSELDAKIARLKAFTKEVSEEGLIISPDISEPALRAARGGLIPLDSLWLSPGLFTRLMALEAWMNSRDPVTEWPAKEMEQFNTETEVCAKLLSGELGAQVTVRHTFD